jgi:hypothetical protein
MHRVRKGKRIEISARDLEIFRRLRQYRYLSSTYIHAFVGGASDKRFKERLGHLFHEGYVQRPKEQWQFANARCAPAVYELDAQAKQILHEREFTADDSRAFLASGAHRQFAHTLMICDVLASLEVEALSESRLRFISWSEILARAPEATRNLPMPFRIPAGSGSVVPDALFGLEYKTENKTMFRFFALEADRGTMPVTRSNPSQTSYLGKLNAYREIIAQRTFKTHLGLPNLLVLTVTTSNDRKKEIMERVRATQGESPALLFKALPSAASPLGLSKPESSVLSEPWERVGQPPLSIRTP